MAESSNKGPGEAATLAAADIERWDIECDVVVVGHGITGAAAAIEAARAGAKTLVLERQMAGGGTTALSTGLTYFGAGTSVQTGSSLWAPKAIFLSGPGSARKTPQR